VHRSALLSVLVTMLLSSVLGACGLAQAVQGGSACGADSAVVFAAEGSPRLKIEVARTPEERGRGLMGRQVLDPDSGMLFVYQQPSRSRFWMKDTLIPLSIAFIAADGTVLGILDMQPETEESHGSDQPYIYALEANQGWFAQHGVAVGQRASICINGELTTKSASGGGREPARGGWR
jgi:uncharacterized protein